VMQRISEWRRKEPQKEALQMPPKALEDSSS
jgi:hypothetical protein